MFSAVGGILHYVLLGSDSTCGLELLEHLPARIVLTLADEPMIPVVIDPSPDYVLDSPEVDYPAGQIKPLRFAGNMGNIVVPMHISTFGFMERNPMPSAELNPSSDLELRRCSCHGAS